MVEINITDSTGKQPRKVGFYANQPENNNLAEINAFKFCQSANLPGISISEVQQQTIFNPLLYPGGKVEHETFSVKFVVSENLTNWLEIYRWIRSCSTYKDFNEVVDVDKSLVSDATLFILNSKNNLNYTVKFHNLFPKALTSIEFDYADTELSTLISSVDFAFSYYDIEVT
jgi:hypothetical protein